MKTFFMTLALAASAASAASPAAKVKVRTFEMAT
jgi:hypothetical protein